MKRIVEETYTDGKKLYVIESNRFLFFKCKWRTIAAFSDIHKAFAYVGLIYENLSNRTRDKIMTQRRVIW